MIIPSSIQTFYFANIPVKAYIPNSEWLQQFEYNDMAKAPYWAQVWPAAKALCEVIAAEPALVKGKTVLEVAAGLGLPSLLAATFAKQVIATDIEKEAVATMNTSVEYNGFYNMKCEVLDWNEPTLKFIPDVLLLSDINYESKNFPALYQLITFCINNGTIVLLSTPQRLVAKYFMEQLLSWRRKSTEIEVSHNNEQVFASVWLLHK